MHHLPLLRDRRRLDRAAVLLKAKTGALTSIILHNSTAFVKLQKLFPPILGGMFFGLELEKAGGEAGDEKAGKIGKKRGRDDIFRALNVGRAKIDADGVKRRFRGAQHDRGGASNGGIHPIS